MYDRQWAFVMEKGFGGVLLSRTVARAVPSAQKSLTAVFGMGTGVTSLLLPPKIGWFGFNLDMIPRWISLRLCVTSLWLSRTTD